MKWLAVLSDPSLLSLYLLVAAMVWMLRNDKDRTRPVVFMALVVNCFYGFFLNCMLGREDSLVPWKYDYHLHNIDMSLGLSSAWVALALSGPLLAALRVIYYLLVPMMILWCVLAEKYKDRSVVLAYVAELLVGPLMYALLPACGPAYAFGAKWLHPPLVQTQLVKFSGMPNAFPSLHVATAMVLMLSARGRIWRSAATLFLAATVMATLSTGEHYVIDLVAGAVFGCFAASAGRRQMREAILYLSMVLVWIIGIRYCSGMLLAHPAWTAMLVAITTATPVHAVWKQWQSLPCLASREVVPAGLHAIREVPVS